MVCPQPGLVILADRTAGYAYCGTAALYLLDRPLDAVDISPPGPILKGAISNLPALLKFLAFRQFLYLESDDDDDDDEVDEDQGPDIEEPLGDLTLDDNTLAGFNGRWNKNADTCYCFWVGGTLSVGVPHLKVQATG